MTQPTIPDNPTSLSITTLNPDFPRACSPSPALQDAATAEPAMQGSSSPQPDQQSHSFIRNDNRHHKLNEPAATAPISTGQVHRIPSKPKNGPDPPRRQSSASTAASRRSARLLRRGTNASRVDYEIPDAYANLDELAAASPIQNPDEASLFRFRSLEDARRDERAYDIERRASLLGPRGPLETTAEEGVGKEVRNETSGVSKFTTQLYTHCYLILFSMLGTLARLGLQNLTEYPGAPVIFGVLWANFGGSLVMGFLAEDRMLFLYEWGTPTYDRKVSRAREQEIGSGSDSLNIDLDAAKKAHVAIKKTIPLYIGLSTGFCGSFTSFSSFIRDVFLAMSNDLVSPDVDDSPTGRSGGFSFMAMVSVILTTVCLSVSALFIGAHLAIAVEPMTPSLPYQFMRKFLDRLAVPVSIGGWITVIILAVVPPHARWRGDALLALAFAPIGCLARFYAAIYLNGRIISFPLGTFVANIAGTAVLGVCWDVAHLPVGGVLGCQVLKGVQDGFCGCLTTVSTWVAELAALRRGHAYVYGIASVGVALAILIPVMGGLRWSLGFEATHC